MKFDQSSLTSELDLTYLSRTSISDAVSNFCCEVNVLLFGCSLVVRAVTLDALRLSCFIIGLSIEIVILTAATWHIVRVCSNYLASLTLRELAQVDPNLIFITFTEIALVQIGLIWSNSCVGSLCLVIHSELCSKTVIALGDAHIRLHSILDEFITRRALIWD